MLILFKSLLFSILSQNLSNKNYTSWLSTTAKDLVKKMLNKRDLVTIKGLICSSMYSASLDYILATSLYYSAQCIFHQGHFSYWGQAQLGSGLWQIGHATIMFTLNS